MIQIISLLNQANKFDLLLLKFFIKLKKEKSVQFFFQKSLLISGIFACQEAKIKQSAR